MVLEPVLCPACQQPESVYRHGKATDGTQRYRHKVHEPGGRAKITALALNGSGVRNTARVLGSSPRTMMGELKKSEAVNQCPPYHPTYAPEVGTDLRRTNDHELAETTGWFGEEQLADRPAVMRWLVPFPPFCALYCL